MASVLGWLDSSERDRRRIVDAIDLLKESGTLDELGIGAVRDTIADVLSPGTSTIQTRPRYFFFIPWIYLQLERRCLNSGIAPAVRRLEVELIDALRKAEDTSGTIGIDSGAALKRLPSEIYWSGLAKLGFCLFRGSQQKYHIALERGPRSPTRDDTGDLSIDTISGGNWHPHLPAPPKGFPGEASFNLTRREAEFFRERLLANAPDSLLTFLVVQEEPVTDIDHPWQHPSLPAMPAVMQQWLGDGQKYSELMHGAQLLYNLLLAEAKERTDWVKDFENSFDEWAERIASRNAVYRQWNRDGFWTRLSRTNPNLRPGVRMFSEGWMRRAVSTENAGALRRDDLMRRLITDRESQLKGPRARLKSRTHLDLWNGASGIDPLNYRWRITQRTVDDIVSGLKR
jgi:hypothetical protein